MAAGGRRQQFETELTESPDRAEMPPTSADRPNWPRAGVIALAVLMATVDTAAVIVATPSIARELAIDLSVAQWVNLAPILTGACLLIPLGRLADRFGRPQLARAGLLVYAVFAVLAALAPNVAVLVIARIVQGAGSALIASSAWALLGQAFPPSMRGRAMGVNGTVIALGMLIGPILGGLISGLLGWRLVFLVAVPMALAAILLGRKFLPAVPGNTQQRQFDWAGAGLLALWIAALTLAINQVAVAGPFGLLVIPSAAVAAGGLAGFIRRQRAISWPLVDLRLVVEPRFALSIGSGIAGFAAIGAHQLITPFLLEQQLGLNPQLSGLIVASYPLGAVVVAFRAGALADRFGEKLPAVAGIVLMAAGMLSMTFVGPETSPWTVALRLLAAGVGQGLFASPNASSVLGSVAAADIGLASAANAWMRSFAAVVGQTLAGLVFTTAVLASSGLGNALTAPAAISRQGYLAVFAMVILLYGLGAALAAMRPTR